MGDDAEDGEDGREEDGNQHFHFLPFDFFPFYQKPAKITKQNKEPIVNNLSEKTLVLVPHRLFSLWDMNQIVAKRFLVAWKLLEPQFESAGANRGRTATEPERMELRNALCEVEYQCRQLGLKQSHNLCGSLLDQISDMAWHHDEDKRQAKKQGLPPPKMSKQVPLPAFDSVYAQLRIITETIYREMDAIGLAVISSDNTQYFEQDELFDKAVNDSASPQLNVEIKAAGNCLAADEHTAAVFHLMRVAEHGLLALANYLGAKPKKSWPLEFSEWQDVLAAIDDELERRKASLGLPRGSALDQELEFYDGLMKDLVYFKDAYRNPVSHLRGIYDRDQARVVFNQVQVFMRRLAQRVPLG